MATAEMSSNPAKMSFAKVAASHGEGRKPSPMRQMASSSDPQQKGADLTGPPANNTTNSTTTNNNSMPESEHQERDVRMSASPPIKSMESIDRVARSLTRLELGQQPPNLVVNGNAAAATAAHRPLISGDHETEGSQRADSGSDLGAKPPSLDGKSVTSGATFALDEKESLRPDDSASVMAAAEDDDAFSVRGSLLAGSRMGSELALRARGIQLGDMPDRRLVQTVSTQGILTPQSGSSEQPAMPTTGLPPGSDAGSTDAVNVIYSQAPDEKLLEALVSPRDKYFLLRLEKDVIEFVQDSKEPYMDLPPSNSFCRMLTHKLADYYHMTHSYEPHIGSVRIFRTPFCRVPPSLALMSPQPEPTADTPPPQIVQPKMKIMRRGQEGESGPGSASASKATSETGSDSKDKLPLANQKLSREEREQLYKLARERIFGSSEEGATPDTEGDNDMSRTSSVSANNRSNVGKRGKAGKQRRDDSDSFDSRHQYTPYWGPQHQTWVPQQQVPPPYPSPAAYATQNAPSFPAPMPVPGYSQMGPGAGAAAPAMPSAAYPGYPIPQYPQPAPQPYQAGGSPMAMYKTPTAPKAPQQKWQPQQPGFSPTYNPRMTQAPGPPLGPNGVPYAYGQLPVNANPHDPKSQHPIPGSYNRNHAFNPKTASFVPGDGSVPVNHPPSSPYATSVSQMGSPQMGGPPHMQYPPYQQPLQQSYGGGYGMARQGSNNSMHGYHQHMTPPHASHGPPLMNTPHASMQQMAANSGQVPPRPHPQQGPNQMYTQLPMYGNPATLPQKPTGI